MCYPDQSLTQSFVGSKRAGVGKGLRQISRKTFLSDINSCELERSEGGNGEEMDKISHPDF